MSIGNLAKVYDSADEREVSWGDGIWLTIRWIGYKPFQDFMQKFYRRYETHGGSKRRRVPDADRDAELRKGIAKFLLPAWRGVKDDDGADIPCTEENVLAALNDPTVPEGSTVAVGERFFNDVLLVANQEEDFRRARLEENAGNSATSSAST